MSVPGGHSAERRSAQGQHTRTHTKPARHAHLTVGLPDGHTDPDARSEEAARHVQKADARRRVPGARGFALRQRAPSGEETGSLAVPCDNVVVQG